MSVYTGFSDTDANGMLDTWLNGAASNAPTNWYVGLLTAFPIDSTGDSLSEPWLVPPVISAVTSLSTGGTIAPGHRYYEVTAVNASGETIASAEWDYDVPTGTSTNAVTVSWGAVPGATSYKLYESGTSGSEGLIASGITTAYYTDTGSATPGASPPTVNGTGYGYARVEVARNTTNFPAASGRLCSNGVAIVFPTSSGAANYGATGAIVGFALFDGADTTASFRASGAIVNPYTVQQGVAPQFAAGTLVIPAN